MTASETTIAVSGLQKFYGDFHALKGIDFSIHRGEVVGFLGPNGAGKSTTMKILTCFMAASAGKAKVMGKDVFDDPLAVRRSVGYLPESVPLYEDMLVYDYLTHMATLRGVAADKRADRVDEVVRMVGLGPVAGRAIGELSKGYRQRVGLAQAIVHSPDVLILDEPTSGLDPNQIVEIRDVIRDIGREKTVLLSTHVMQEIEALCDRIIVIASGKIVADGTFEDLYARHPDARTLEELFRMLTSDFVPPAGGDGGRRREGESDPDKYKPKQAAKTDADADAGDESARDDEPASAAGGSEPLGDDLADAIDSGAATGASTDAGDGDESDEKGGDA